MVNISYRGATYNLRLFSFLSSDSRHVDILSFLKEIICLNQGELAQFSFMASEFHKRLKDALNTDSSSENDVRKLRKFLSDYCGRNNTRITKENFKLLHNYFDPRHRINPRICVKVNESITGGKNVVTELVRDEKVAYLSSYALGKNSGFKYVARHGTHYLCNNIPQAVRWGDYENARINNDSAKLYKQPSFFSRLANKKKGIDPEWVKCWKREPPTIELNPTSCYRSTLIIPMTLWNNDLSDEYKKLMKIKTLDRTILGYLCFDHVDINYFNREKDVPLGYITADILSLYLLEQLVHTEYSHTFTCSKEFENDQ